MLQAGPSYFAYQHVLKALKKVVIPFPQYLTAAPIMKKQVPEMAPPSYLGSSIVFDMSVLVKKGQKLNDLEALRCDLIAGLDKRITSNCHQPGVSNHNVGLFLTTLGAPMFPETLVSWDIR